MSDNNFFYQDYHQENENQDPSNTPSETYSEYQDSFTAQGSYKREFENTPDTSLYEPETFQKKFDNFFSENIASIFLSLSFLIMSSLFCYTFFCSNIFGLFTLTLDVIIYMFLLVCTVWIFNAMKNNDPRDGFQNSHLKSVFIYTLSALLISIFICTIDIDSTSSFLYYGLHIIPTGYKYMFLKIFGGISITIFVILLRRYFKTHKTDASNLLKIFMSGILVLFTLITTNKIFLEKTYLPSYNFDSYYFFLCKNDTKCDQTRKAFYQYHFTDEELKMIKECFPYSDTPIYNKQQLENCFQLSDDDIKYYRDMGYDTQIIKRSLQKFKNLVDESGRYTDEFFIENNILIYCADPDEVLKNDSSDTQGIGKIDNIFVDSIEILDNFGTINMHCDYSEQSAQTPRENLCIVVIEVEKIFDQYCPSQRIYSIN